MNNRYFLFLLFFCFEIFLQANDQKKIHYPLTNEPIDVLIVSHPKDKKTLNNCIKGIKENCSRLRRVVVVSAKRLTLEAEWYDENNFPFSINEVALQIGKGDQETADRFFAWHSRGPGWYFQQLLKLYASFVIPDLSSNLLVVDADTVFMNPVSFLNAFSGGLFCISHKIPKDRYIHHAERLVLGYQRVYPEVYSVCHHMLFQKPILTDLFKTVENYHQTSFWKAFCSCVSLEKKKGASEYEIYYNYALTHTDQVELRELKWINCGDLSKMEDFKKNGYHFVSFHTYLRKPRNNKQKAGEQLPQDSND